MSSVCIPGNRHSLLAVMRGRPIAQHDRCVCGVDTDHRCLDTRADNQLFCASCSNNCPKPGEVRHQKDEEKCIWCGDMVQWDIDADHYHASGMAFCGRAKLKS